MSTPYDVSTISHDGTFSVRAQERGPHGVAISHDGTKMYVTGWAGDDVNEYTLSVPYDVTSAVFVDSFSVKAQENLPFGIVFSIHGTKMFVTGDNSDSVNEYVLSTPYDVTSAVFTDSFSVKAQEGSPRAVTFALDGSIMFVTGHTSKIYQYSLSIPYDVSTASYTDELSVHDKEVKPNGIAVSPDGTNLFVTGPVSDAILQYTLE